MAKTHEFTANWDNSPVSVVLDKISTFRHDPSGECTVLTLIDGQKIAVTETVAEVTKILG